jgi:hypothetical protein
LVLRGEFGGEETGVPGGEQIGVMERGVSGGESGERIGERGDRREGGDGRVRAIRVGGDGRIGEW